MALKSDLDAIKAHFRKSQGSDSGGSGANKEDFYSIPAPQKGEKTKAIIRIAGPWSKRAEGIPWYALCLHWGFKAGGGKVAIPCFEVNFKNPYHQNNCPVCEFAAAVKESDNPELKKNLLTFPNDVSKKWNNYFNIFVKEDSSFVGPHILRYSMKLCNLIQESAEDEEIGDITHPVTGRNVILTRTGAKNQTRYTERLAMTPSKISYQSKDLHQLDKIIPRWRTIDEATKLMRENFIEEMREVGLISKKPKVKKAKLSLVPKKKKKVVEEVDYEEDLDADIPDDDFEEDDE